MSAQYDFVSPTDLSALSSATLAQIAQAINTLGPLANIGGIIGQTTEPDVANNARFARYLWLNTSTGALKYYTGAAWAGIVLSTNSVINTAIAAGAVRLTHISPSEGSANQVLQIAADGLSVEWENPADLFANGSFPLAALDVTGAAAGYFLKYTAAGVAWQSYDPSAAVTNLAVTALAAGTNLYLLRTNATGTVEWVSNNDTTSNFLAATSVNLSKLAASGASSSDIIRYNGSAWVKVTPDLDITSNATISNAGVLTALLSTANTFTIAHGLGATPRLVRMYGYCNESDATYAAGDIVDVLGMTVEVTPGINRPMISCYVNSTNVVVVIRKQAAGEFILDKTGGGFTNIDTTKWKVKVFAWK